VDRLDESQKRKLFSTGAPTACAIALHNFPEGLVAFVGYVSDPAVGVALTIAIATHNIPEGLCVAMPIYYATGSKWKAFWWGTFSGISEPLGALICWLVVGRSFAGNTFGVLFGLVTGIMVYICIDELLPTAYHYNPTGGYITWTCVFGMFLISLSLMLFSI
jgi:zinc transporter, ZIP family